MERRQEEVNLQVILSSFIQDPFQNDRLRRLVRAQAFASRALS